jgi:hypothetical protein
MVCEDIKKVRTCMDGTTDPWENGSNKVYVINGAVTCSESSFGQGSVYCNKNATTGACEQRIDYRIASSVTNMTDPCSNGFGKEYVINWDCTGSHCIEVTCTVQFEQVLP